MPPVTPLLVTRASATVRPVGALWRLRGYLRPFRFQMIVMFAAAFGAVAAEITIPLLIKAVIDGAIAHGYRQLLVPLALAAIGLGVAELGRGGHAAARHDAQAAEVYRTQVEKASLLGSFWALLDLIPNAVIGLIIVLGAIAVSTGTLTLGGLVAFITLALQLVWPVEALGYIIASGQEAATAAQRVLEIFDTAPEITDPDPHQDPAERSGVRAAGPGARPHSPERSGVRAAAPAGALRRRTVPGPRAAEPASAGTGGKRGHLVFDHVSFSYPGAAEPVLRDIVLDLPPGRTVVLTGATGSGKSTLLQLVPRLADATSGAVRLDGTDVRDLPLERLRAAVGCAFEDATLFSASVRENVTFGTPDADEDAVEAALTAAQARFAYDLPWGLDTRIGEQGMALSGGQRQRIALARAILAGPDVLILDDPLSALDVHTEERVTRALHEVLPTRPPW
jgi:ATP-binding cassette, subfamily B, bacterial